MGLHCVQRRAPGSGPWARGTWRPGLACIALKEGGVWSEARSAHPLMDGYPPCRAPARPPAHVTHGYTHRVLCSAPPTPTLLRIIMNITPPTTVYLCTWLRLHCVHLMRVTPPPPPRGYAQHHTCCLPRYTCLYQSLHPPTHTSHPAGPALRAAVPGAAAGLPQPPTGARGWGAHT